MAMQTDQFQQRLGRLRRRYKLAAAVRGLLLVLTEALGCFLLLMLLDWVYGISGTVMMGLWTAAVAALAVLAAAQIVVPLCRRIDDEQIALLVEERAPESVQGSVITALEETAETRAGLHQFIARSVIDDAVSRMDRSKPGLVANLARLKKYAIVAAAAVVIFAATGLTSPSFTQRGRRVISPWESIARQRREAQQDREAEKAREDARNAKIEFTITPGDVSVLRGKSVRVDVKLSREPQGSPQLFCRTADGEPRVLEMNAIESVHGFSRVLTDINEPLEYWVVADTHPSSAHTIRVFDPLHIRGMEITYHYPAYLQHDPVTAYSPSGDIEVVAGTKVDLKVVANNRLAGGELTFEDQHTLKLAPGAKAEDGASASFTVDKDTSYTLAVADDNGQKAEAGTFFYVKALPDEAPTIELTSPKVDMSVHPLCEVTFAANVGDDYGIRDAVVKADLFRGATKTPLSWPMKVADKAGGQKNVKDGTAEYVLELDGAKSEMKVGDMMFYHVEAADAKGQSVRTDVYFVKMMPLETAANWPDSVASPDLPHEVFNDPMDLMLFMAAAWSVERQRGKIPADQFNTQSEGVGDRMAGGLGDPPDFALFWGYGGDHGVGMAAANQDEVLAAATQRIDVAYGLLKKQHEPGKAAGELQTALALAESVFQQKRHVALELNPEPIHTGQPSSGYSNDPISEQIQFRSPSTMTDALTAFQQPDNPPRLLPPDYRRALKIKQRQGSLTKQIKVAGEIYASEEQLIEMAKEQLGQIQLREAVDPNSPNDPSVTAGLTGEEIRVDKRAIPYKELASSGATPEDQMQLPTPKIDKVKGLPGQKIPDNKRRGGPNPFTTQAQSSSPGEGDDEPEPDQSDPDRKRQRREPSQGGGAGSSSGDPEMAMRDPNQREQAAMAALAGSQADQALRARELARDVAKTMDADDAISKAAVGNLRDAAGKMEQAAGDFRRGDVRGGLAKAMHAQEAMRSAIRQLNIGQYDSLAAAVAAAQNGAAALAANQDRVAEGTRRVGEEVNDLTGKPAGATPGEGKPAEGKPSEGKPSEGKPSEGKPAEGKPSEGSPGQGRPGTGEAVAGKDPEAPAAGGGGEKAPDRKDVLKAMAADPRIGPRITGLAKQQADLAKDLQGFVGYVEELKTWADKAQKDRVAGSLSDVTGDLKRNEAEQKMIDAAMGLAGQDIQGARDAQQQVAKALDQATSNLQTASDLLAGTPAGLLRRAAKDANQVGEDVRRLAGLSGPAQGNGQKDASGQGKPREGTPAGTQPAEGNPDLAQNGQAKPNEGQTGQGTPDASLARQLSGQDPSSDPQGSGSGGTNRDIGEVWMRTRRLVDTLRKEQLAESQTIRLLDRQSDDLKTFRRMFEKARQAEAGRFADVAIGVGTSLEEALAEAMSAKRLAAARTEECPPQYRAFVNAYFEALSRAAADAE